MKKRCNQVLMCKAKFFEKRFKEYWGLGKYTDINQPVVFHGIHTATHYKMFAKHKGPIIVLWVGGGLREYTTPDKVAMLKSKKNVKHYACSVGIHDNLNRLGIQNEFLPIVLGVPGGIAPLPLGNKVYAYNCHIDEFYGKGLCQEMLNRTGMEVIYTTVRNGKGLTGRDLLEAYKNSFIGLRLTPVDGIAMTVIELGLMGRRCIHNGDSPSAIPWENIDDICESVMREYDNRHNADYEEIARQTNKFIDIGDEWLYV